MAEALETVFPRTEVQLCLVHKVRQSLQYVVWKGRRAVARDLRAIYGAATLSEAESALETFAAMWDAKYPTIRATWRRHWSRLTIFFDYPQKSGKPHLYHQCDRIGEFFVTQSPEKSGGFPTDESILKVLYLGIQRIATKWTMSIPDWKRALNQFAILLGDRVPTR